VAAVTRFGTVLVANRGEIALRVIRAASAAGLYTVAVYSDADRGAPHVRAADTALHLGPALAAESYLSIPALLAAVERSGADAVHPGYGFLSERAAFARAVTDAGHVFIGPSAAVMDVMGRKDRARAIAVDAGVPVVPSSDSTAGDDPGAVIDQIGLPLLVKAAAGGGGKGMRIVRRPEDLPAAIDAARREASAAFGDDTLIFERYVEHGRHVEVQIVGDEHGAVVHLFERDCSVQRRYQKVIEEAPATTVSPAVRETVRAAAVALARQVGYVNAGTVEFLVAGDEAYFLEMNTRLQVEHPVTEVITGIDLVQVQFAVAQGEPLPFTQADVAIAGHAIEARVYAEDPYAGFLPQAGVADAVAWPEQARVDAALERGQRVSTFYDPMLGKITASGTSREAARRTLVSSLDDTAILGLTTNLGYLRELVAAPEFQRAEIDTAWLDSHPDRFVRRTPVAAWCLAAWTLAQPGAGEEQRRPVRAVEAAGEPAGTAVAAVASPFSVGDGWRAGAPPAAVPLELADRAAPDDRRLLHVDIEGGRISSRESAVAVRPIASPDEWLRLEIDGQVHAGLVLAGRRDVQVAYRGQSYVFDRPDAFGPGSRVADSDGVVAAPMPGTVLAVHVAVGDQVRSGAALGVLEAMKMELVLKAPFDGTVAEVNAATGDSVDLGKRLFAVEPGGDA
jgi:acetyl/propionyl-CoA carboxylase alpha subunit